MAPNPASVHCLNVGGRLEILKTSKGEVGICHLPDGTWVEEWRLYTEFSGREYLMTDFRQELQREVEQLMGDTQETPAEDAEKVLEVEITETEPAKTEEAE